MSDVRYHINPQTGNVNQCKAFYSCRFKMSEAEHYETKEEAKKGAEISLASENIDTDKYLKIVESKVKFYDNDNRDIDFIESDLKSVKEWTHTGWTNHEKENLYRIEKLVSIFNKKKMTQDDWNEAERIMSHMKPINHMVKYQRNTFGKNIINEYDRRDRNLLSLAKNAFLMRKAMEVSEPDPAPEREVNSSLIGGREAQLENLRKFNDPGYEHMKGRKYAGDSVENYFDSTLNRIIAGENYKPFDDRVDSHHLVPKHDQLMHILQSEDEGGNNQLYMATVFPDKELKEEMDRAGISNVSVSSFYNSREYGNAYTVMTPDGDTRTFSVYEHRNTDSIVINGKTNWKGSDVELPYTADSKHEFFAEIPYGERKQAARTLTYFMKNAQNGTLEDDQYLSNNAPRRDWNAILSEQIPGFKDWHEENFPAQAAEKGLNEDEDILRRLDFDNNEEN